MTVFNTFKELEDYCADPANSLEDVKLGSSITSLACLFVKSDRTEEQFKGIEKWDVSRVTDFSCMFFRAENFNSDISGWDVGRAVNMRDMFALAENFNQNIESWDVSGATDMYEMFLGATAFNQPLGKWDVSRVRNMTRMFWNAEHFNQPLNEWQIKKDESMFEGAAMDLDNYPWVERVVVKKAEELKDEPESESFKAYRNYEDKLKKLFGHCA